jgi:hypothetical protein
MTKEKAIGMSDLFLKLIISALIALCTFALNSVVGGIGEVKQEIKTLRIELQSMQTDLATLKTRVDYHERAVR